MLFFVLVAIVAVALFWIGLRLDLDWLGFALSLIGALLGALWCICLIAAVLTKLSVPGDLAQVAAVRAATQSVNAVSSPAVYGQAVEVNKTIASNQALNRLWWADPFIPNEWDTVRTITLPDSAVRVAR